MKDAGTTNEDIAAFWHEHSFDVELPNIDEKAPAGNRDLCFV